MFWKDSVALNSYSFTSLPYIQKLQKSQARTYPERTVGRCCLSLFRICCARVSTRAILPSFDRDTPFKIAFKESISALQAVSKESSILPEPEWAAAMEMDWPINATQGMSNVIDGPCPERSACTSAKLLWSVAAWSTLLITPTVLVPAEIPYQILLFIMFSRKAFWWWCISVPKEAAQTSSLLWMKTGSLSHQWDFYIPIT